MISDIRLVVFDLDGTLVDSMSAFADYAAKIMQNNYSIGYSKARSLYLETSGLTFRQQLERIFPGHYQNQAVANIFEEWKKVSLKKGYKLRDGARDAIRKLLERGLVVCISSNNVQEHVDKVVKRCGLRIQTALGYRHDGFGKGAAHFQWLEQKFGTPRSQMIFVGDSPNDYLLSCDAGVSFVALTVTFDAKIFKMLHQDIPCFSELRSATTWILRHTIIN